MDAFTVFVTRTGVNVPPSIGVSVERKKEDDGRFVGVTSPEEVPPPPPKKGVSDLLLVTVEQGVIKGVKVGNVEGVEPPPKRRPPVVRVEDTNGEEDGKAEVVREKEPRGELEVEKEGKGELD